MLKVISRYLTLRALPSDRRTAAVFEYALLTVLIAVVIAIAAMTLGAATSSKFDTITSALEF